MKTKIQDGLILNVLVLAAVVSGQPAKNGSAFGVYVKSGEAGETVPFDVGGVHALPKDTSVIAGFGTLLYWDDTAKKITTTASGNTKVGYAIEAAATDATIAKVRLVPTI